uniref:AMP-dependent synthetase/ligase domain-containing protein n=1 Tax=Schizophyllum commune (strain H4-8 / FGSC 9210) TaxID=578458 RepID=D8PNZ0_SCHCM
MAEPKALFVPDDAESSPTHRFMRTVNERYSTSLSSYRELYKWSTENIDKFWGLVWDETHVRGVKGSHVVDASARPPDNPTWFRDAKLNWAENMLVHRSPDKVALVQATEPTPDLPQPPLRRATYAELYSMVADIVSALLSRGFKPGDRVASYASNCIENVAACLATTALGGIWLSASADFGPVGVLERFEQVQPKFVFAVDAVVYNAKVHPHLTKLKALLDGLADLNLEIPTVIVAHVIPNIVDTSDAWNSEWMKWDDFLAEGREKKLGRDPDGEIQWSRQPFDYPLWILFSSGTTGMLSFTALPIVHRAGGMLLQANKEFAIHGDLRAEDVFFYYTTTGWMMWNFLVSGLAAGCTLVLYDGSPLRDPAYLWRLVDDLGITLFGTSAKYIDQLSKSYKPREHHSLSTLRHIYSTGSPLAPALFDYVYEHIHPRVLLGSITGGTDICSLFAGMCTALPVFRGEIQCRMLGMAIEAFTPDGKISPPDEPGELVCLKPFPCQPVGFWPLEGFGSAEAVEKAKARYQQSYFSEFPGVWYHGDHIIVTCSRAENGGGVIMLGRSDGVLNPGGIRFGSAEIYEVVDHCFHGQILDCLAVGQSIADGTDERVVLFVKLAEDKMLDKSLEEAIKREIRARRTPRHVPSRIVQTDAVPYTLNGKRVEVSVKKIINGASVASVNPATLANPECLEYYKEIGKKLRAEVA